MLLITFFLKACALLWSVQTIKLTWMCQSSNIFFVRDMCHSVLGKTWMSFSTSKVNPDVPTRVEQPEDFMLEVEAE